MEATLRIWPSTFEFRMIWTVLSIVDLNGCRHDQSKKAFRVARKAFLIWETLLNRASHLSYCFGVRWLWLAFVCFGVGSGVHARRHIHETARKCEHAHRAELRVRSA